MVRCSNPGHKGLGVIRDDRLRDKAQLAKESLVGAADLYDPQPLRSTLKEVSRWLTLMSHYLLHKRKRGNASCSGQRSFK